MRFFLVYVHENGGSMPLEALSAKARLMVPVGAIAIRWELRMPCFRIASLIGCGRREAKLPPDRYRSALNIGNAQRSRASSIEARYARSRMNSVIFAAV